MDLIFTHFAEFHTINFINVNNVSYISFAYIFRINLHTKEISINKFVCGQCFAMSLSHNEITVHFQFELYSFK